MRIRAAEALIRTLPRYERRRNYPWRSYKPEAYYPKERGRYVRTLFWRRVPEAVDEAVHKIMQRKYLLQKTMEIDFGLRTYDNFWTIQAVLHQRNMIYIIRRLSRVVAGSKPVLFYFQGRYVIWNGHHRLTCAALLGRRIKVRVFKCP